MKFVRGTGAAGVTIPKAAMKLSGLSGTENLELHTLDGAAVLLKQEMTAMELLTVVSSLDRLSGDLLAALAIACEKCMGCEDSCPFSQESRDIRLPKYLLDAVEIPEGATLCAEPDPDTGRIIVSALEAEHDLSDVPEELLDALLECGVCLGSLSELLGSGEAVYGAH